nr:hypothetical protein [uncultured Lachnoclostridium sp.]
MLRDKIKVEYIENESGTQFVLNEDGEQFTSGKNMDAYTWLEFMRLTGNYEVSLKKISDEEMKELYGEI